AEERLGVLDGVALGQRIAGKEQLSIRGEHDGFGRGAAEVAADQHGTGDPRSPLDGRRRAPSAPLNGKGAQIFAAARERASAVFGLLLVLARLDPPLEPVTSLVNCGGAPVLPVAP